MRLLLRGGTIVDPSQGIDEVADLLIEEGKIVDFGRLNPGQECEVREVGGCVVVPGLIDMHVHLREPGREDKETIESGCRAAAAGGFTSIVCMPDTRPVNDCEAVTGFILDKARKANLSNVFPVGAVTKGGAGTELAEYGEMHRAGIVALSEGDQPVTTDQIMRRALEYARQFDLPLLDHCEDLSLAAAGSMNEGSVSTRLGLRGISSAAEEVQVARDLILARLTGSPVHICHLSTRGSLEWVRQAKKWELPLTCEVTPHHLLLSDEEIEGYDTNYKVSPPLRTKADVESLLQGLKDGTIDCIASDHAPQTRLEKEVLFEDAADGMIGLETALPLVWNDLVERGVIGASRLVELMSVNPSRILNLNRGTLRKGAIADITVIDPQLCRRVDVGRFQSKSRNCPFHGRELKGWPTLTIVAGRIVWQPT